MTQIKGTSKISINSTSSKNKPDVNNDIQTNYQNAMLKAKSGDIITESTESVKLDDKNLKTLKARASDFLNNKVKPNTEKLKQSKAYLYGINKILTTKNYLNTKLNKHKILKAFVEKSLHSVESLLKYILRPDQITSSRSDILKYTRGPAIFGIWVTIISMLFLIIWGFLAPLNSGAGFSGYLTAESKKRILQHPYGGLIKRIFIKDGDKVEAGELLISLDKNAVKARTQTSFLKLTVAEAERARLIAERDDALNVTFPEKLLENAGDPEVAKIMQVQQRLFTSKKNIIDGKINSKKEHSKQLSSKLIAFEEQLDSIQRQIDILAEQQVSYKKLSKDGHVSKFAVKELEQKSQEYRSRKSSIVGEISIVKDQINQINIDIETERAQFLAEIEQGLRANLEHLEEARALYAEHSNHLENLNIVAPTKGTINNLAQITEGGTVSREMPILEIIPQDDNLIFEGRISPQDIDIVKVGQVASVRFSPFKAKVVPAVDGTITYISSDIIQPKHQNDFPHYNIRIVFEKNTLKNIEKEKNIEFYPGMPGDGTIAVGTRTFMKYIFDPITTSFSKAFIEQ
jgi:HlyD family type I secretion membrane fusion protein